MLCQLLLLLLFVVLVSGDRAADWEPGAAGQHWGYVEVRTGAHMFYWLYHTTANVSNYAERPLVIWLQGGPGAAATALGNFGQLGPMDIEGNYRNFTWVKHVNLLFIDSPVGTGFSYMTQDSPLATNNTQIAKDLLAFMQHFYVRHKEFVTVPLHIFTESYGGKMSAEFALQLHTALESGDMGTPGVLKSVTMGNPWLAPQHIISSYARYLYVNGFVDEPGAEQLGAIAKQITNFIKQHKFYEAMNTFMEWFEAFEQLTGKIYLYNTQTHVSPSEDRSYGTAAALMQFMQQNVSSMLQINGSLFNAQGVNINIALHADHMKSAVHLVTRLLNETPVKLNIYSGQLDVICTTLGTAKTIKKMNWLDKAKYLQAPRVPIYIEEKLQGHQKIGGNFGMFWINRSGHLVSQDNPAVMNYILKLVTNYE